MSRELEGYPFCGDEKDNRRRIGVLRSSGVNVSSPERVYVGPEVQLQLIQPEAMLVQGIIRGKHTVIGAGAFIGTSGTAVLQDVQVGRGVELGAGSYRGATLLDGAKVRGFAELRHRLEVQPVKADTEFIERGITDRVSSMIPEAGVVHPCKLTDFD